MRLAELEIPARAEYVSLARLMVSSIADDRYELSADQLDNLKLAVSEACVLAIGSPTGEAVAPGLAVRCDGSEDHLDVSVVGGSNDEFAVLAEHLEAWSSNGADMDRRLGIPLIGSLVDDVTMEPGTRGNTLRLRMFCIRAEEL